MSTLLRSIRLGNAWKAVPVHCKNASMWRGPMLRASQWQQQHFKDDDKEAGINMEYPDFIDKKCFGQAPAVPEKGRAPFKYPYHEFSFYDLKINTIFLAHTDTKTQELAELDDAEAEAMANKKMKAAN